MVLFGFQLVSLTLKEPGLEFELLHPVLIKRRVIDTGFGPFSTDQIQTCRDRFSCLHRAL